MLIFGIHPFVNPHENLFRQQGFYLNIFVGGKTDGFVEIQVEHVFLDEQVLYVLKRQEVTEQQQVAVLVLGVDFEKLISESIHETVDLDFYCVEVHSLIELSTFKIVEKASVHPSMVAYCTSLCTRIAKLRLSSN